MSSFVFDSGVVVVQVTPQDELERRAARLQTLMREAGLDGVMATQNASVFYFSGVIQQAQVYIPVEGSPLLLVRKHHGRAVQTSQLGSTLVVGVRSLRQLPGLITEAGGKRP